MEAFPTDLWQDEGRQVIALIRHLNCGKAGLVGTSGGAWAALNAALECPELICAVVADSFDGRKLHDGLSLIHILYSCIAEDSISPAMKRASCAVATCIAFTPFGRREGA